MSGSRYLRLGPADVINLAAEARGVPMHMTAVAILDGAPLLGPDGRLRLAAIRRAVSDGLADVPALRRVLHESGLFGGDPIWVDADRFDVRAHVGQAVLPAPADERALLALATELMIPRLDRARPLWRMWFVTGLPDRRLGLVVVVHHVLADGLAAAALLLTLLDRPLPADDAPAAPPGVGVGRGVPSRSEATWDNVRSSASSMSRAIRRVPALPTAPRPPARRPPGARAVSLNRPVGPRRHVDVLRLPLDDAERVAHAHGATVNDLVLGLTTGGLRALLRGRGEPVDDLVASASVAVSTRGASAPGDAGNRTGALLVELPIAVGEPAGRLRAVAARTAAAKATQTPGGATTFIAALAKAGVARWFSVHQHLVQVVESDLTGPASPVRLLGAPVRELIPIGSLAGNVPFSVLALSYAGSLVVAIQTDVDAVPDAGVFVGDARRDWDTVRTAPPTGRPSGGRPTPTATGDSAR